MEQDNSPRKIQFTVPLLEPHLDPEAAEQIRRRRPTPATLVLTSDQSSPEASRHGGKEIDEDRLPNPLFKSTLSMSPRQRKKVTRTTPTMKELQMMVEHHLGQQQNQQGEETEAAAAESEETQQSCGPESADSEMDSKLSLPGAAQSLSSPSTALSPGKSPGLPESIPKIQETGSEERSSEAPTIHIQASGSRGAD